MRSKGTEVLSDRIVPDNIPVVRDFTHLSAQQLATEVVLKHESPNRALAFAGQLADHTESTDASGPYARRMAANSAALSVDMSSPVTIQSG